MSQPSWPPANLSHNAKDNKALQRHICLFRESSRTMTSQGRSENSDQSGPLHPMLSNADRGIHAKNAMADVKLHNGGALGLVRVEMCQAFQTLRLNNVAMARSLLSCYSRFLL